MKLRKLIAVMALAAMAVVPMTASAANVTKEDLKPAQIVTNHDKEGGLDLNYVTVKNLKSVAARHAINRAIYNAAGDLILEHHDELQKNQCTMTITPEIRFNEAGILSLTLTSEGQVKGAAHGFKSMRAVNYNYLTGEKITVDALNQLYKAAKMAPGYTLANINKALEAEEKAGKITLINKATKLPPFYLTGKAMDIMAFFQPYEVAPYANGIVTVEVQ